MRRAVKERRIFRMHPLDLSPKTNPSHFKSYCGEHRKSETLFLTKDNNKKAMCTFTSKHEKDSGKRGRPRADKLTTLMVEGSSSRSKIRCNKCGRVFPREKSLQAHLRTHTGERPYPCDYPGCTKAFCQSGQLKTHQRLHTGEKPFVCNIAGCTSRFTHANRHCSTHPNAGLRRTELNLQQVATQLNQDQQKHSPEKEWLERYIRRCKDRLNPRSDTSPLDMRKQSTARPRDFAKRKTSSSTTTISVTSTETITMFPSPSPPREEYNKVFFTPLPRIPPYSPPSSTPSKMSPVPFPVSPPNAHRSSVTLTPLTPRHPGSASSISSRSSSSSTSAYSSSSSSSFSSSGAVRDLSSFIHTPTKSSSYSYHISPDKPSFEPAPYCSAVITDHISHSPYYGQVLPPPPSLARPQTLTSVQAKREMKPSIIHHPIKREKDRYISALALIELSKG